MKTTKDAEFIKLPAKISSNSVMRGAQRLKNRSVFNMREYSSAGARKQDIAEVDFSRKYIFIHGAWHSSFCWNHMVVPLIESNGYRTSVINLPIANRDSGIQDYAKQVCLYLEQQSKPVILVGHSMGAMVANQAYDALPDKVKEIIYIAGCLPRSEESLLRAFERVGNENFHVLGKGMTFLDKIYSQIDPNVAGEIFYNDCNSKDIELYKANMSKQNMKIFNESVLYDEAKLNKIPKTYVECLQDNAIPVSAQRKMYSHLENNNVISVNSSHSPFYSQPQELVRHLIGNIKHGL